MIDHANEILKGEPLRSPIECYSSVGTLQQRLMKDVMDAVVVGGVVVLSRVILAPTLAAHYTDRLIKISQKVWTGKRLAQDLS